MKLSNNKLKLPKPDKPKTEWLEFLWKVAIKCRANFASELTPNEEADELHPHHIIGKDNLWMRLSLDNGICLNAYEHKFMAHGTPSKQLEFKNCLELRRGKGIQDKLYAELRWKSGKPNLYEIERELLNAINPYVTDLINWLIRKDYKSSSTKADYKKLLTKLGAE